MTGFGKASLQLPTKKITVEVKSLNSKGLDFYLMLHLVVPDSTPDADMAISIRESDLENIVVTIAENVTANKLDVVTMNDFIADNTVWSGF